MCVGAEMPARLIFILWLAHLRYVVKAVDNERLPYSYSYHGYMGWIWKKGNFGEFLHVSPTFLLVQITLGLSPIFWKQEMHMIDFDFYLCAIFLQGFQ